MVTGAGAGRTRRQVAAGLAAALGAAPFASRAQTAPVAAIDAAGRRIALAAPARRIVLSDALETIAFSLIAREPAALIAGWSRARLDDDTFSVLAKRDPRFAAIPQLGVIRPGSVPVEAIITIGPDLVVLGTEFQPSEPAIAQLEAAGIPVAILSLAPSLRRLDRESGLESFGRLIGREDPARAYAGFFRERVARIRERAAAQAGGHRPAVLLEAHAGGATCCMSPGRGESIGDFVTLAGGENIGADIIPGMAGTLSLEYVIQRQPEVFIGTGGPYMAARGGLVLGTGKSLTEAQESLRKVAARPGLAEVPAVAQGRVHGVAHTLTTSGLNIVAIEAVARWTRPELFADLDHRATMRELEQRFLGFDLPGTFTVDLPRDAATGAAP